MYDEDDIYVPWFAENDEAIGFQLCQGKYKDSFVYIIRNEMKIKDNTVTLDKPTIQIFITNTTIESVNQDKLGRVYIKTR